MKEGKDFLEIYNKTVKLQCIKSEFYDNTYWYPSITDQKLILDYWYNVSDFENDIYVTLDKDDDIKPLKF